MTCPKYEGDNKCSSPSIFWTLSEEHVAKYCEGDHKSCSTYQHEQSPTKCITEEAFLEIITKDNIEMYGPDPMTNPHKRDDGYVNPHKRASEVEMEFPGHQEPQGQI